MVQEKLKLNLPETKECNLETTLQVFDYQIAIYPTLKDVITMNDLRQVPLVYQGWVADMVYEKFGLEEEDVLRKGQELEHNTEFIGRVEKFMQVVQQDMSRMYENMV